MDAEYVLTTNPLNLLQSCTERLSNNPILANSIRNRFAYLDPLNNLQVELIKQLHNAEEDKN